MARQHHIKRKHGGGTGADGDWRGGQRSGRNETGPGEAGLGARKQYLLKFGKHFLKGGEEKQEYYDN